MKMNVKVTADFTGKFNQILSRFRKDEVLVGIPEEKTTRSDDSPINNATILAINEFGSPSNNIPARPVMKLGIKAALPQITNQFKLAAQKALTDGTAALDVFYNRAGIIASNSIKKTINAQIGFDGPAASTLKRREAMGFKGTKALIVTGQLRNSITYVLRNDL